MIDNFYFNFSGISKRFGRNQVLEDTGLSLRSHDCIVMTGENGAGKTTLLRIIAGLEQPDRFHLAIDDGKAETWRSLRKRLLKSIMYLHQQPYMLAGTLRRNLDYAAKLNPGIVDRSSAVNKAMQWAGLEQLAEQNAASLSGGQKQRVALARARLRGPQILLLDEPTANLDNESRQRTLKMLQEFRDTGTAILIVSHDPNIFEELVTASLHLEECRIQGVIPPSSEVVELDSVRQSQQR